MQINVSIQRAELRSNFVCCMVVSLQGALRTKYVWCFSNSSVGVLSTRKVGSALTYLTLTGGVPACTSDYLDIHGLL
jgi:hypothetical protein